MWPFTPKLRKYTAVVSTRYGNFSHEFESTSDERAASTASIGAALVGGKLVALYDGNGRDMAPNCPSSATSAMSIEAKATASEATETAQPLRASAAARSDSALCSSQNALNDSSSAANASFCERSSSTASSESRSRAHLRSASSRADASMPGDVPKTSIPLSALLLLLMSLVALAISLFAFAVTFFRF